MATTVTYKGSTLTTATNETKILKTAGKYMEDDVTIEDVSSGGSAVVVTEELAPGGGIIKHITAIDLSNDTVDAAHLYQGYTAHNFQGEAIVGTMSSSGGTDVSDTTLTADHAEAGYYFYLANGTKTQGTLINGNNLGYGITDGTIPKVGIAKVGSAHAWSSSYTMMTFGSGQIGTGRVV